MNLKKAQSIARRRLGLTGEVEFVHKDGPGGRILAVSNPKASLEMKHVFVYSKADSLDPADVYHEMSRAKPYQLGFKTVENAALVALKDCAGEISEYIFDANSAVVIVAEVYTSYLLYSHFSEEVEKSRLDTVLRFESSDALTSLHTQMGFWGTAGIAYYRAGCESVGRIFRQSRLTRQFPELPTARPFQRNYKRLK